MTKYRFRGSATIHNTEFFVTAPNKAAAVARAADGDFDEYDTSNGVAVDWDINVGTAEPMG